MLDASKADPLAVVSGSACGPGTPTGQASEARQGAGCPSDAQFRCVRHQQVNARCLRSGNHLGAQLEIVQGGLHDIPKGK